MKLKTSYNLTRHGICLLLLLSFPLFSWSSDYNTLYKKANEQYRKAQYQEAIKSYQQILDGGRPAEAVYFNLGNAYFKLGDIPSALLYYEKAHKLAPGDEDINFNIYFANSKTTDKVEPEPEFFVSQWWRSIILFFSIGTLSILSVLSFIAGFGLLVLYLFTNVSSLKKASFYIGILMLFSGLLFVFISNRQVHYFNDHHQAIIFTGSVNVRSGPGEQAATLFVLHDGTKVNILDNNNGWIKVQLANGNEGWIHEADIKEI
ncbi:MAG: Tetratricopeptide repeat protein [Mucilaginibacter sp.]|nr:Tetratricopeptide repeat protein [Mucilaginibacter sp.]